MQAPLAALAQSTQDELAQLQTDPGSVLSDALAKISPKDIGLLKSFLVLEVPTVPLLHFAGAAGGSALRGHPPPPMLPRAMVRS